MSQIIQLIQGVSPSTPIETLTGNTGGAVSPTAGNVNIIGTGAITVTGNPGTSTLTVSTSGGGLVWFTVTSAAAFSGQVDHGYVAKVAAIGFMDMTLPAVAAVGDRVRVMGHPSGNGWIVRAPAGQQIYFDNTATTVGGAWASTLKMDSAEFVCIDTAPIWSVGFAVGNLTVS